MNTAIFALHMQTRDLQNSIKDIEESIQRRLAEIEELKQGKDTRTDYLWEISNVTTFEEKIKCISSLINGQKQVQKLFELSIAELELAETILVRNEHEFKNLTQKDS